MSRSCAGGAPIDQGNPDDLPAMMEAANKHGKYQTAFLEGFLLVITTMTD
jgi:hypothetical protein